MPIDRALLVVETAAKGKVEKALAGNHEVLKNIDGKSSSLFMIRTRGNVASTLKEKKIPLKSFRCLWINDESAFAREGKLEDKEFSTHFVACEYLNIASKEFERIESAHRKKDGFVELCRESFFARMKFYDEKGAIKSAKIASESFKKFLKEAHLETGKGAMRTYSLRSTLPSSYGEVQARDWVKFFIDHLETTKGFTSSFDTFVAFDLTDWWDFNKCGTIRNPTLDKNSLDPFVIAEFTTKGLSGRISSSDISCDGHSLE